MANCDADVLMRGQVSMVASSGARHSDSGFYQQLSRLGSENPKFSGLWQFLFSFGRMPTSDNYLGRVIGDRSQEINGFQTIL